MQFFYHFRFLGSKDLSLWHHHSISYSIKALHPNLLTYIGKKSWRKSNLWYNEISMTTSTRKEIARSFFFMTYKSYTIEAKIYFSMHVFIADRFKIKICYTFWNIRRNRQYKDAILTQVTIHTPQYTLSSI